MARFWLRLYLNRVGVKNTVPRHGSLPFYSQMYYNLDDTIETRQRERSVVFVVGISIIVHGNLEADVKEPSWMRSPSGSLHLLIEPIIIRVFVPQVRGP